MTYITNSKDIRKIQQEENFQKSIFLYLFLIFIGLINYFYLEMHKTFTVLSGINIHFVINFALCFGMIGFFSYFSLILYQDRLTNKAKNGLETSLFLGGFLFLSFLNLYAIFSAEKKICFFLLLICYLFCFIIIFRISSFVFAGLSVLLTTILIKSIQTYFGQDILFLSLIYITMLILMSFVLDNYSCKSISQQQLLKRHSLEIIGESNQRACSLFNQVVKIKQIQKSVLINVANLIEYRDMDTGEHVKRTQDLASDLIDAAIANNYCKDILTDEYCYCIVQTSPLHDIGKIAISDSILNAPRKLTDEEFTQIKTHSEKGGKIIRKMLSEIEEPNYVKVASEIAKQHHERWDGTGYPKGLKGDEISLGARIMSLADVYDALTNQRCYKKAFSVEEALKIIEDGKGTQFDPTLTDLFVQMIRNKEKE